MKRIISLLLVTAVMMVSALSVNNTPILAQTVSCDPWQKAWDISEDWWYFQWYRWCYAPSAPEGLYVDWDGWEWWAPVTQVGTDGIDGGNGGDGGNG